MKYMQREKWVKRKDNLTLHCETEKKSLLSTRGPRNRQLLGYICSYRVLSFNSAVFELICSITIKFIIHWRSGYPLKICVHLFALRTSWICSQKSSVDLLSSMYRLTAKSENGWRDQRRLKLGSGQRKLGLESGIRVCWLVFGDLCVVSV